MYNETQIDNTMPQWMLKRRFTSDARTNALIRQRVLDLLEQNGGQVSVTHFERAALELMNESQIAPFRGTAAEHQDTSAIPADVVAFIESPKTSSFELRRRYAMDREFKRLYDLYTSAQIKKKVAEEQSGASLTVEKYNALPAATIIKRYRSEVAFRKSVDALVAKGLI